MPFLYWIQKLYIFYWMLYCTRKQISSAINVTFDKNITLFVYAILFYRKMSFVIIIYLQLKERFLNFNNHLKSVSLSLSWFWRKELILIEVLARNSPFLKLNKRLIESKNLIYIVLKC